MDRGSRVARGNIALGKRSHVDHGCRFDLQVSANISVRGKLLFLGDMSISVTTSSVSASALSSQSAGGSAERAAVAVARLKP